MGSTRAAAALAFVLSVGAGVAAAAEVIERQRIYDQAGEAPQVTLVSPDEQHFYIFGQSDIVIHALFPAGNPSPRVGVVRRLPGLEPIGQAADAVISSDGKYVFYARRQSIVSLTRNPATGQLSDPLVAGVDDPNSVGVATLLLSPDDRFLYALYDDLLVYRVDPAGGALTLIGQLDAFPNLSGGIGDMTFSADSTQIVLTWLDQIDRVGVLSLVDRDPATGTLSGLQLIEQLEDVVPFPSVGLIMLDENTVLSTHGGGVARLFRRSAPASPFSFLGEVTTADLGLSFSQFTAMVVDPQRQRLYAFDGERFVSRVARFVIGDDPVLQLEEAAQTLAMSSDPRFVEDGARLLLASAAEDRWVLLDRQLDGGLTLDPDQSYDGSPDGTQGLAFVRSADISPDGSTLALQSLDSRLLLFDVLDDGRLQLASSMFGGGVGFGLGADSLVFSRPDLFFTEGIGGINVIQRESPGNWSIQSSVNLPFAPTLLEASSDGQHLYAAQLQGGELIVRVFSVAVDGSLGEPVLIRETLPGVASISRSAMSRNGDLLYIATGMGVAVFARDPTDGALVFQEHAVISTSFDLAFGMEALANDRLAVSAQDAGLVVLSHGESGALTVDQRLQGGGRGLAVAYALFQPAGSPLLFNLPLDAEFPAAVLQQDREGRFAYRRALAVPALEGASQVVGSPDGRFVYVFGSGINALSVFSVEALFEGGFELGVFQ